MKLKVCGVRTMPMVQACQDLEVSYIGFNFVPTSKRRVDLATAQHLSHAYTGKKVGVFQNQSPKEILETLGVVDLDIIQLHGHESPTEIEALQTLLKDLKKILIWKVVTPTKNTPATLIQTYGKKTDLILFDGSSPGTGQAISAQENLKSLVQACHKQKIPYALAGGINQHTAASLLNDYETAHFFDTASGVETIGQFDKTKLENLLSLLEDA